MPITNNLKTQVDQPVFEWLRPAPNDTAGNSTFVASRDPHRLIYYTNLNTTLFAGRFPTYAYRYDTYSDSWQESNFTEGTIGSLMSSKLLEKGFYAGIAISATSSSIKIGGIGPTSSIFVGKTISIIAGRGAGQTRTITSVGQNTIHDYGTFSNFTTSNPQDSTKKWLINQWRGYGFRIIYNPGESQQRLIFSNSRNVINFNFSLTSNISPFLTPNNGVNNPNYPAQYVIESIDININSPWSEIPDSSSIYSIETPVLIEHRSGSPAAPVYRDLTNDTICLLPVIPPSSAGNFSLTSEFSIETIYKGTTAYLSGFTAASGTTNSLSIGGFTMEYDRWANHELSIISGRGVGQKRRIVGNTNTQFFVNRSWEVTPNNTSVYEVNNDVNKIWLVGNASASVYQHTLDEQVRYSNPLVESGTARNISIDSQAGTTYGRIPYNGYQLVTGISKKITEKTASQIVYSASGVLAVSVNTAGGTYQFGDLVTLTTTGTNAQAYVTGITAGGAVTSVQLAFSGSGYVSGTSTTSGGSGSGLILGITAGRVGNITLIDEDPNLKHNDTITIAGCTTDSSFNGNFQIIGINSTTTFSIANPSGSASPTALNSQSTTTLVDASKNWNTNQHVGRILVLLYSNTSLNVQRRILSNTATTITVAGSAITTPTNGSVRYAIFEPRAFGSMVTTKIIAEQPYGWATSGTATTLVDTTKNWRVNQWQNCRVRVMCGTGEGNYSIITSNTSNTLTVASWGVATPDATSKYEIMDSFGVVTTAGTTTLTDAQQNWETNNLVGKRVRIIGGSGVWNEATITANTATVLTLSASITTASSSGDESSYAIYEVPVKGAAPDFTHLYGLSNPNNRGKYLISPRGAGSNIMDLYDITRNIWIVTPMISPYATTLTTGSMYAYDGLDTYLFTKEATGRIYALDLNTFKTSASATIPYAHNTAIASNRMTVVTTEDGLKYLYILRHSARELWRTLKFW